MAKKIMFSGLKPTTANLHLGNYFGFFEPFLKNSEKYQSIIFIADLHALTSIHERKIIKKNTLNILAEYLSLGLDSKKIIIFRQSDFPEITYLSWIFSSLINLPYLERGHVYKGISDKISKSKINLATFSYPILMAADILIQDADIVTIGPDQSQHLEIARDVARKFNLTYKSNVFKEPQSLIFDFNVIGLDGQKMSKSYNNFIPVFSNYKEIESLIKKIKTSSLSKEASKNPDNCYLYQIYQLFLTKAENKKVREQYLTGGLSYAEIKKDLIEKIINKFEKSWIRKKELLKNSEKLEKILEAGAKKIRPQIENKIKEIEKNIGI